jgi:hypothetical protein
VQFDEISDFFSPGDTFHLVVDICNNLHVPLESLFLFVFLAVEEQYWFAPSWSNDTDYYPETFSIGETRIIVIDDVNWPDDAGSYSGAVFWSAVVNPDMTSVIGDFDNWIFGWGESR